jgi:uncharacterized protein (DUF58 family)
LKIFGPLYINRNFYIAILTVAVLFVFGYFIPLLYPAAKLLVIGFVVLCIIDLLFLFSIKKGIVAKRLAPEKLSNGDENPIQIKIQSIYRLKLNLEIIDEIPFQFQHRDFFICSKIDAGEDKIFSYSLRPFERGEYTFGKLRVYVNTDLHLFSRRYIYKEDVTVPVYPSFLQMRKYELLAISNRLNEAGIKKVRTIGRNFEFDQIRKYNTDDDYRTINWKATARKGELMVNQYEQERSQQVYSLIDMGRTMKMPFEGITLFDYAINSSLVISNIALLKHDKAGLLTFSENIHTFLQADRKKIQISKIMELLYNQETNFSESNYELLYNKIKRNVNQRSLLLLYSNFESLSSMQRQLGFMKLLAQNHLTVVIFFINTEIQKLLLTKTTTLEEIYIKTIAEKMILEKKMIVKELNKNGIYTILTEPKNLSVSTINKYLEFKSLGLI